MEALGFASNIVQFVDFVAGLISTGVEIAESSHGALQSTLELEKIYESLSNFKYELGNVSDCTPAGNNNDFSNLHKVFDSTDGSQKAEIQAHIQSLQELGSDCKALCEHLLNAIDKLRVNGSSFRIARTFMVVLRSIWSGKKIKDLESRIARYQKMIYLHFFPLLGYVDSVRFK